MKFSMISKTFYCFVFIVGLQACVQEMIWPSDTRVQVYNNSSVPISKLSIESLGEGVGEVVLVPEEISPGQRSRVYSHDLSGNFTLILRRHLSSGQDTTITSVYFQDMVLDGGSVILKYKDGKEGPRLIQD